MFSKKNKYPNILYCKEIQTWRNHDIGVGGGRDSKAQGGFT